MSRCGCGSLCSCVLQAGSDCISITGNGSVRLPYIITPVVSPSPDNLLVCDRDGLLVDVNSLPPAQVVSANGVSGNGLLATPLIAEYSTDVGNQATAGTDGHIFVPFPSINTDLTISGDGTAGSPLSVFVSTDAGNVLGFGGDGGLYTIGGGAAVVQTSGNGIIGDGSGGDQIRLDFPPIQQDQLEVAADGLRYNLLGASYLAQNFLNVPPGSSPALATNYTSTPVNSDSASVFTTNTATGQTTIIVGGMYHIDCMVRSIHNIALGDNRWSLASIFIGFTGLPNAQEVAVEVNHNTNTMTGFTGQTVRASGVVRLNPGNIISTFGRLIKVVGGGAATVDHLVTRRVAIYRLGDLT